MKNYLVSFGESFGSPQVRVQNKDDNSIIDYVELSFTGTSYSLNVFFRNNLETQEMKDAFDKIEGNYSGLKMDYEAYLHPKLNGFLENLELIQTIDPIPDKAFDEIMGFIPKLDLTQFSKSNILFELVSQEKHVEALEEVIQSNLDDPDKFMTLATIYFDKGDKVNYIKVIEKIPESNPHYDSAQKFLHEHLNSLDVSSLSIEDQWVLLEDKFRTALNAKLESAPFLFDQLCGNNGLNPLLKEIKGDATTLIAIARTQRQMKIEMDNLKLQIQSLTGNNVNTSKKTSNDFSFFTPDSPVTERESEIKTPENK